MKSRSRRLFLILSAIAILLGGCESTGGGALFLSSEGRADDVYYAESPPRQTPEKELSECLLRVARQVAMREGVRVRHVSRPETVAGETYEKKTTELSYDQGNAIALLDRMTVLRVESDGAGTRALVRVSGSPRLAATLPSAVLADRAGSTIPRRAPDFARPSVPFPKSGYPPTPFKTRIPPRSARSPKKFYHPAGKATRPCTREPFAGIHSSAMARFGRASI
jgi:hypothetical protein